VIDQTESEPVRTLTDADVEAIAAALERKIIANFYSDLGKGVWGIAWKVLVGAILAVAAYGAVKGIKV
jgi:hypothetical protein